jgi:hypothetical protein
MADESNGTTPVLAKNFFSAYANNVHFELQSLDLRIIFAQTRQNQPAELQGAVVMSWPEAKLMAHFLARNLAIYEVVSGKIAIPPEMLPKEPPALKEDESNETVKAIHSATTRLYRQLIDSL